MAKKALGLDTASDELTVACLDVRDAFLYPDLQAEAVTVARLTGAQATSPNLIALLPGNDLLTASGHGLQDKLMGQVDTVLEVGQYPPAAVRQTIIHLLACDCGELLGPDLVSNGCRAFFGYREQFVFPLASPRDFLDCDSEVDRALAQGLTAEEVFDRVMRLFNRRIAELRQAGHNFRAALVEHNRDCFVAPSVDPKWGDPTATL